MALSAQDAWELYQLYTESTRRISAGDIDGWVDLFTEDGEFHIPAIESFGAPATDIRGAAGLRAYVTQIVDGTFDRQLGHPEGSKKRYLVNNISLEGGGDEARGTAYLTILLIVPGQPPSLFGTGVYRDRFARTEEGWKLARRELEPEV